MMRPTHIAIALALCTAATAASAQPAPRAPSVPPSDASALPAASEMEETEEAPRTIVTETRDRGQVTGATVTRGGNTYYLKPNMQTGSAQAGDAQSSGNRAAQWQIFQFDWQREPNRPAAPPPGATQN